MKAMPAAGPHSRKPHIYSLEATGVIVIALIILILTIVRYWHRIHWSII